MVCATGDATTEFSRGQNLLVQILEVEPRKESSVPTSALIRRCSWPREFVVRPSERLAAKPDVAQPVSCPHHSSSARQQAIERRNPIRQKHKDSAKYTGFRHLSSPVVLPNCPCEQVDKILTPHSVSQS